ncbi:hypothetical protein JST97_26795 [bacterium]|nr:hypothetical protein [bacterium]
MSKGRPKQDFDELPKRRENYALRLAVVLLVLFLALAYWRFQPSAPVLHAQDVAVNGIHLGQDYQEVLKLRGSARRDERTPDGLRNLVYSSAESYVFRGERVIYMEARGSGGVQFPHFEARVGDSRDSLEKQLGVVDSERKPELTQVTWPGPDCRLRVEFDQDWKARAFRVYSP